VRLGRQPDDELSITSGDLEWAEWFHDQHSEESDKTARGEFPTGASETKNGARTNGGQ